MRSSVERPTTTYRRVIAPIDPDHAEHRALGTAIDFARRARVPLTIAAVGARHQEAERQVALASASNPDLEIEFEVLPSGNDTAGTLCAFIDSQPGSLVCMPTHAIGGVREAILHPTSTDVLASIHRPVVLVGPDHRPSPNWNEIAVFVDGSSASEPEARFATDLALSLDLPLNFLRVLPTSYTAVDSDITEAADLRHYAATAARHRHHVTWDVLHHRAPERGILDWLCQRSSILVVLGAHSHPGVSHLRSPSITAHVAHHAAGPVLVVPADNLLSDNDQ
ncbi:MAG: universal stress protein [Acidimicrobiia bacterium]